MTRLLYNFPIIFEQKVKLFHLLKRVIINMTIQNNFLHILIIQKFIRKFLLVFQNFPGNFRPTKRTYPVLFDPSIKTWFMKYMQTYCHPYFFLLFKLAQTNLTFRRKNSSKFSTSYLSSPYSTSPIY